MGQLPHPVVTPVMKTPSQTVPPSWQVRVRATGKIGIGISPTGTNPTSLEALVSRQLKTLQHQTVTPIPDTVEDICSDIGITVEEGDAPEGRSSKGAPGGRLSSCCGHRTSLCPPFGGMPVPGKRMPRDV